MNDTKWLTPVTVRRIVFGSMVWSLISITLINAAVSSTVLGTSQDPGGRRITQAQFLELETATFLRPQYVRLQDDGG